MLTTSLIYGCNQRPRMASPTMLCGKLRSAWLDSWRIPRRWPAGPPAPYRQLARPRSRALWALGGHFGASQVPECDNLGPGGIDIDHLTQLDASIARELPEPALTNGSPVRLRSTPDLRAAAV